MSWKRVEDMNLDEVEAERANLESYFNSCREGGHGINTKERVRYRDCLIRLAAEGTLANDPR
jgi:hypothetical protein